MGRRVIWRAGCTRVVSSSSLLAPTCTRVISTEVLVLNGTHAEGTPVLRQVCKIRRHGERRFTASPAVRMIIASMAKGYYLKESNCGCVGRLLEYWRAERWQESIGGLACRMKVDTTIVRRPNFVIEFAPAAVLVPLESPR